MIANVNTKGMWKKTNRESAIGNRQWMVSRKDGKGKCKSNKGNFS